MNKARFSLKDRIHGFSYAFNGIRMLISGEHNARLHCIAALCVVLAGIIFNISAIEWALITICIASVFAAEGINSAVEALSDLVSPEWNPLVKRAKDIAAGSVLIIALASVVVAVCVFVPKICELI